MQLAEILSIIAIIVSMLLPIFIGNSNRIAFESKHSTKMENITEIITELKIQIKLQTETLHKLEILVAILSNQQNNHTHYEQNN